MGFLWNFYKWGAQKSLPFHGKAARRNAETERLLQICDDLSVTFGDSSLYTREPLGCTQKSLPCVKGADRGVRPYKMADQKRVVGADDSVGPLGSCKFAAAAGVTPPALRASSP